MAQHTIDDIHTVAFAGNSSAGKTTLVEALLHAAGAIKTMGSVDKGTTVSDFDPLEKQYVRSLSASVTHAVQEGRLLHIVDTPGYTDFYGEALSALPVSDTVVVVVDAQNGVEMMTRRVMERASELQRVRMIVINKIDAEAVDLSETLTQIQEAFGKVCLPINLPAGNGTAVIDCLTGTEGESDLSTVAEAHGTLVDQIVEVDEALMEKYLEDGEVSGEQLQKALFAALRDGHLIPVCFTSATAGAGVPELLRALTTLTPTPAQANPLRLRKGESADVVAVQPSPDSPVIAHVFKVSIDPFSGKVGYVRVLQGRITKESQLYVGDARKPLKISHSFRVQGKELVEVEEALPGDIIALTRIDELERDVLLHESRDTTDLLPPLLPYPPPMFGVALEPAKRGDEQKLSEGLTKIVSEAVCFFAERDHDTKELVARGLGEMQVKVMLERLKERYHVEVTTRPPKIAYRETIAAKAEGHHRHKKQTGGAGQFGEVYLRVEPLERGAGFEFKNEVVGGTIPSQYIPAVEKGVRQVLANGAVAGYPMHDVRVCVYDGKHHAVDSKEIAFVTAGKKAFVDAISKASPRLLEPMVNLEIVVPSDLIGTIAGDMSSRRGQVKGTDSRRSGMTAVNAAVPLAEISDYQSFLKSVSQGRGSYTMDFSHYEPAPKHVQEQIVALHKPKEEED